MALRELFAELDIRVNDSELMAAEQHLDSFEASLQSTLAETEGQTIQLPDVELPDIPELDIATGELTITPELDDAAFDQLDALVRRSEQEVAQLSARMVLNPKLQTAEANAQLQQLQTNAANARAKLQQVGTVRADKTESGLAALSARLTELGNKKLRTPAELNKVEVEAKQAATQIAQLARIDARNPSIPKLQKQLGGVNAQLAQAKAPAKAAAGGIGGLTGALGSLGVAFSAYQVAGFVNETIQAADEVGKLSTRLGIATDDAQAWSALAEEAGAGPEALEASFKKLSTQMYEASQGTKTSLDAFNALGISATDADGNLRPVTDVLTEVGGELGAMSDEGKRAALAQELLGRGGAALLPGFKAGAEGAKEQLDQLKALAPFSQEFIDDAEGLDDELHQMGLISKGVAATLISSLMPAFRSIVKVVSDFAKGWDPVNSLLAGGVLSVVALTSKFGGLGSMLLKGAKFGARFVLPFLVLEDVFTFLRGGDSVLGRLLDKMLGMGESQVVLETIRSTFDGIVGAAKLLWATLTGDGNEAWAQLSETNIAGLAHMTESWEAFKTYFGDLWDHVKTVAQGALASIIDTLGGLLSKIPLIGESLGGLVSGIASDIAPSEPSRFAQHNATEAEIDSVLGSSVRVPRPTAPAPTVAAPQAAKASVSVNNAPVINQTFNNTGTPASPQQAVRTASNAAMRSLDRGNRQVARQAGVAL